MKHAIGLLINRSLGLNVNDRFSENRELFIWRTGISQVAMTTVCQHHYEGYIHLKI